MVAVEGNTRSTFIRGRQLLRAQPFQWTMDYKV
jgi:hypothetical protein